VITSSKRHVNGMIIGRPSVNPLLDRGQGMESPARISASRKTGAEPFMARWAAGGPDGRGFLGLEQVRSPGQY
jgi:hypothetical protein